MYSPTKPPNNKKITKKKKLSQGFKNKYDPNFKQDLINNTFHNGDALQSYFVQP